MPQPKPIVPAHVREAERQQKIEAARTAQLCTDIVAQLSEAGWTSVSAAPKGPFIAIRGVDPAGRNHSAALTDGQALADFLLEIGVPPPPRKAAAPLGYDDEAVADKPDEGEPLPDPLARLVPDTVEQAKRKEWLRERHTYLNHLINGASTFGAPSEAVIREHQELERYRGFFA